MFDGSSQLLDFPDTILASTVLGRREIRRNEQFGEWCVDDEKALVRLQRMGFGWRGNAEGRLRAAQDLELCRNAAGSERFDLDWDAGPPR